MSEGDELHAIVGGVAASDADRIARALLKLGIPAIVHEEICAGLMAPRWTRSESQSPN